MKLVVGLGNPGKTYARTRHNVGFLVVDEIAKANEVAVKKKLCDALVGEGFIDGEKILLVKPQTYMNRSGVAVKGILREYRLTADDMVVVYDDLDLPFGRIRIRPKGSAGGHRGIQSILESLAGAPFYRVRVGIGRPAEGMDAADYVLAPFGPQEFDELNDVVSKAAAAVLKLLRDGGATAMQQSNHQ